MYAWNRHDWTRLDEAAHLKVVRAASPIALDDLVRNYDWDLFPEPVLGWAMAQKGIELACALTGFFNGTPERFNHLQKRDVPEVFHPAARLLDNICLRVNCGFYSVSPHAAKVDAPRLRQWVTRQQNDRKRGVSGRWVLDEMIVSTLLADMPDMAGLRSARCTARVQKGRVHRWFAAQIHAGRSLEPHLPK
ncbi:hypothetical protein G5B38_00120 [Pseudohalocynthiibacter aestuariivivens]|nr:hypothetical protein [Pseudohalocynthiibacter aestuariivivens]QIE44056.1 hypothetical protein G5B38_00120 [Pseudohalocynthiibacter aestuariivivens]